MQSLQNSIQIIIELQAKNLQEIAEGKTPEIPIEPKVWAEVIKMIEIMPKFKLFEAIVNGEPEPGKKAPEVTNEPSPVKATNGDEGNAFEQRSKAVKAKLNGETSNSPKKD